jgi:hypothetical protein
MTKKFGLVIVILNSLQPTLNQNVQVWPKTISSLKGKRNKPSGLAPPSCSGILCCAPRSWRAALEWVCPASLAWQLHCGRSHSDPVKNTKFRSRGHQPNFILTIPSSLGLLGYLALMVRAGVTGSVRGISCLGGTPWGDCSNLRGTGFALKRKTGSGVTY